MQLLEVIQSRSVTESLLYSNQDVIHDALVVQTRADRADGSVADDAEVAVGVDKQDGNVSCFVARRIEAPAQEREERLSYRLLRQRCITSGSRSRRKAIQRARARR